MMEPRPIPVERFLLRAVGRTDVGAQRTQNEDTMYYDDFLGVYVVCDGMGGHASGQVASDIAIRTIVHAIKTGGYHHLPAKTHHYAYSKGPAVVQINGQGPFDITYINEADDPSKMAAPAAMGAKKMK